MDKTRMQEMALKEAEGYLKAKGIARQAASISTPLLGFGASSRHLAKLGTISWQVEFIRDLRRARKSA